MSRFERWAWSWAVLVCGPCLADWTAIASAEFRLGPPPAPQSELYRMDFRELHRLEDAREESDCRLAATQKHPSFAAFFGDSAGILSGAEQSRVAPLMKRVFKFTERVSGYFKSRYRRPRPYTTDDTLEPCVERPTGSKSYPSSHAATAAAGGCVLASIFPDRAKRLETHASYLGRLRAIVGVHHPSDVEAGQDLGQQICERLLSEEDFQAELP